MLFLDPQSVRKDKMKTIPTGPAEKSSLTSCRKPVRTASQAIPARATAEDGQRLFIEMGEALTAFVRAAKRNRSPLPWFQTNKSNQQ